MAGVLAAILDYEARSLELRMAELRGGTLVPDDMELSHSLGLFTSSVICCILGRINLCLFMALPFFAFLFSSAYPKFN